ncbi:MAG: UDP-3-O-acyl-N-acetylglucosamine deacetylase, partial [Alphaproteobacteria bacterium]|nr:UDP-3-O-acyl-N-acetylglucosamine deacetylase [Alphaproteobacteria bacterium]
MISYFQQTLNQTITLHGVGVHSGLPVELRIEPAPADHGIVFYRSDLPDPQPIPALYHAVTDTRMSTTLKNQAGH